MINPGQYEGKAIKDTVQYGETSNGSLQIGIDMELFDDKGVSIGSMTTLLYFTEAAAIYSYERLRAMGWKGQGPDEIDKLDDIFETKVPVRVTVPEAYTAADGTEKMGSSKLEILTGGGSLKLSNPVEVSQFKARLRSLGAAPPPAGQSSGGGNNGGGPAPPF